MRTYDFAGIPVASTSGVGLIDYLLVGLQARRRQVLLFANANFVVQCRELRDWLRQDDVLVVNDGVAMDVAGRLIHKSGFQENLNGTDFCPRLLDALPPGSRVYLLGGRPGVAAKAAAVIAAAGQLEIAGHADGYGQLGAGDICSRINASGADVLLVALGNPRQERWIKDHVASLDAMLVIGVGALFDFLSGAVRRAPMWVRRLRAEWLFRLMIEPRRLIKRYTVDVVRFLWYCRMDSSSTR